jgi:hypothetical protein
MCYTLHVWTGGKPATELPSCHLLPSRACLQLSPNPTQIVLYPKSERTAGVGRCPDGAVCEKFTKLESRLLHGAVWYDAVCEKFKSL